MKTFGFGELKCSNVCRSFLNVMKYYLPYDDTLECSYRYHYLQPNGSFRMASAHENEKQNNPIE